jgi:hypothetical protein
VQQALDQISETSQYRLFVVFVETFDDFTPVAWANQTAQNGGLGADDVLLAIATIDRLFGFSLDNNSELTAAQRSDLQTATENAFNLAVVGQSDWADATVATANHLRSQVAVQPGGSWTEPLVILGVIAVAGAVILALITKRRHSVDDADIVQVSQDDYATMPTEEMQRRATAALVGIDDALKTNEQELSFATAEFGEGETGAFATALEKAKEDVKGAFRINQQVIDGGYSSEQEHRGMLMKIITICEGTAQSLNARTADFDELRQMSQRAPELLDQTEQRAASMEAIVATSRGELARLSETYSPEALASVANNPAQAEALITDARKAIDLGRDALAKNERSQAVVAARGAQNAVGQAEVLLRSVKTAGADLQEAIANIPAAMESITADIADAKRLSNIVAAAGGVSIDAQVAEAEAALAAARQVQNGGGDPIEVLTRLQHAEADIDLALVPARAKDEGEKRARKMLPGAVDRAASRIQLVNDFVTTRRQMVGPDARTMLSEAVRLFEHGQSIASGAPQEALKNINQAERLADQAADLAQQDIDQNSMYFGGGGADLTGMLLGGIVMGSLMRGSMMRAPMMRSGLGFGGYGWGGGLGGPMMGGLGGMRGGYGGSFGGGMRGGFGGMGGMGGGMRGGMGRR